MQLTLAPEAEKIINDCMKSGQYVNAEEVVRVALQRMVDTEPTLDFGPGELDRLLQEGLNSGLGIPFETFLAEFDDFRKSYREGKK